jgi:ABC-type glycerol-3-phosphate transport system substrate-binding protein
MVMVNRDSPTPLYYQLKAHFKDQMANGLLRPGDRLPTEREVCKKFGVSRAPVRQALTDLANEGYVYRRPGRGTFVASSVPTRLAKQTCIQVMTHYDIPWITSLEQAVNNWNTDHPDQEITLEVAIHRERDKFHRLLRQAVATGAAPDLISLDFVWITHYAQSGYIKPLDEIALPWLEDEIVDLESPVRKNNTVDDRYYGTPIHADLAGLWYRKDFFQAEELEPPETWDELLALLEHFNRPDVKRRLGHDHVLAFPVSPQVGEATCNLLMPFLWNAGARLRQDTDTIVLDNNEVYRALRFLREITTTHREALPPQMHKMGWWDFAKALGRGNVAMILGGTYEWPHIRPHTRWEKEPEVVKRFGFAPAPRPTKRVQPVCSLGGISWAIPRQSAHPEVALTLLRDASSPHASASYCEHNLQISPYRSVNKTLCTKAHPWLHHVIPLLRYAHLRPMLFNYPQISPFIQDMLYQTLWLQEDIEDSVQRTSRALDLLW